jgi:hypothetical protein
MSQQHPHAMPPGGTPGTLSVTSETTVGALLMTAINAYTAGIGGALEFNGQTETVHGAYAIHIHVCVEPLKRGPVN